MNVDKLVEQTNSFEEFRLAANLTSDEALQILLKRLKELKGKNT
jgi:hypothetical protein